MTFEQWWKEYCVKRHLVKGSPTEIAMQNIAYDAWAEAFFVGYRVAH